MEEAIELYEYLPVLFRTTEEREYIDLLLSKMNYSKDKFQFAFLAYHMLTMSLLQNLAISPSFI